MTVDHLRLHGWLAAFICVLALSSALYGQGLGMVLGTVTDPSGALVPSATVKITEEATSLARSATTDAQGYYMVPSLQPGSYTLSVETPGVFDVQQERRRPASGPEFERQCLPLRPAV